jgi:division protein CdvB (Snf7/Vps24/ESCRT-III family)
MEHVTQSKEALAKIIHEMMTRQIFKTIDTGFEIADQGDREDIILKVRDLTDELSMVISWIVNELQQFAPEFQELTDILIEEEKRIGRESEDIAEEQIRDLVEINKHYDDMRADYMYGRL